MTRYDAGAGHAEKNTLGMAAFICSIIGLLLGGILSPVGLVLSLIAMGRRPRGFAVAGLIIGLIGSCGLVIGIVIVVGLILAAGATLVSLALLADSSNLEVTRDMVTTAAAIEVYRAENRYLPADLTTLELDPAILIDPWGQPYAYHLTEEAPGYDLDSAGPDQTFGSEDDLSLSGLGALFGAEGERLEVAVEEGDTVVRIGSRTVLIRGDGSGSIVVSDGERSMTLSADGEGGVTVEPGDGG